MTFSNLYFLAVCLAIGINYAAPLMLPSTEDIPLSPDITVANEEGITFEGPTGRIVTAKGHTSKKPEVIQAFYNHTLPSLGWVKKGPGSYHRERERLAIEYTHLTDGTEITFTLTTE